MEINNENEWHRTCDECKSFADTKSLKIGNTEENHGMYLSISLCKTCRKNLYDLLFQEWFEEREIDS